jgi:hypothetical protein
MFMWKDYSTHTPQLNSYVNWHVVKYVKKMCPTSVSMGLQSLVHIVGTMDVHPVIACVPRDLKYDS